MAWSITRNFPFSFQPIYYLCRVFGHIPFSIVHDAYGEVLTSKVRAIDGVLFVGFIILHLLLAVYYFLKPIQQSLEIPYILILAARILPSLTHCNSIITIIMNMYNRHKIINIMRMFNAIDKEMMFNFRFNMAFQSRRFSNGSLVIMVGIIISYIIASWLSPFFPRSTQTQFVLEIMIRVLRLVSLMIPPIYFTKIVWSLHQRFAELNLMNKKRFSSENSDGKDSLYTMKRIGRYHSALIDIMDETNSCFSFQIMSIFGLAFIRSVLTVYTGYRYILQKNGAMRTMLSAMVAWQQSFLLPILLVVHYADKLTQEARVTTKLVHEIINSSDVNIVSSNSIAKQLENLRLTDQVQHRSPVAACKLFAFDWNVIFKMTVAEICFLSLLVTLEKSF